MIERLLVKDEPCVRAKMGKGFATGIGCNHCPLYQPVMAGKSCHNACGTGYLFIREQAYIEALLEEGNDASL
jgi:hypothetical protein